MDERFEAIAERYRAALAAEDEAGCEAARFALDEHADATWKGPRGGARPGHLNKLIAAVFKAPYRTHRRSR